MEALTRQKIVFHFDSLEFPKHLPSSAEKLNPNRTVRWLEWISFNNREGVTCLAFSKGFDGGTGHGMHAHCHEAWGHVTTLRFLIGKIALKLKWVQIALICCVLGHLLVPELIIKGWEGLNLANFKELFIGTVNVINFVQMLDSSCWQFVVHGQGAVKQMGLVSPDFNLHL